MKQAIFDIETNGLELSDVTVVHCIAICDVETGDVESYKPDNIEQALIRLNQFDRIIGHNIIWYDLPVLKKLYNWVPHAEVLDTLVLSRLLSPERQRPLNMRGKAGAHSIEAWGVRLGGQQKIEHEDWSTFSFEMLKRCIADVKINRQVYLALTKEANA